MKYIKPAKKVLAFRLGVDDQPEWFTKRFISGEVVLTKEGAEINTSKGKIFPKMGDWIILEDSKDLYFCPDLVFTSTYGKDVTLSYFIHPTSIVDEGAEIGEGTKIWHYCHISKGAKIGKNCVIGQNCYIGEDVTIGDYCKLQNNVSIYKLVTLEEGVFCGPSCVFTNDPLPRAFTPPGWSKWKPTLCKKGASIGANATIVCGTTLGEFCLVGAGTTIVKDVPVHTVVINGKTETQEVVGFVCSCGNIVERKYRPFEKRLRPVCPKCGMIYSCTFKPVFYEEKLDETKPMSSKVLAYHKERINKLYEKK